MYFYIRESPTLTVWLVDWPKNASHGDGRLKTTCSTISILGKKQYIHLDDHAPMFVLGLASNDRIWKVCWNINQQTGLNLSTGLQEVGMARGPELYLDNDTSEDFEYLLFEYVPKGKKTSAKAAQFRFWLVLKPKRETEPDLEALLGKLNQVENVSLAMDLSQEKDIKKLIP